MKSSNGNEDIVKAAISASKQAAELKESPLLAGLESILTALGYQITLAKLEPKEGIKIVSPDGAVSATHGRCPSSESEDETPQQR